MKAFINKFLREKRFHRTLLVIFAAMATLCAISSGHAQSCVPAPTGIVAWWSGESNSLDNLGNTTNAISAPASAFAPGKVGQAFNLNINAQPQLVGVQDSPLLHFTNAMSVEAWINPANYNAEGSAIVSKFDSPTSWYLQSSWNLGIDHSGYAFIVITTNGNVTIPYVFSSGPCPLGAWTHLAGTYDGTNLNLYVNGVLQNSLAVTGSIYQGPDSVCIGATLSPGNIYGELFYGMIDEPALYNRALTANEVQGIYNAGSTGKCPLPPTFTQQPTNQTIFANGSATFNFQFHGSQPSSYQWMLNGQPISGATGSSGTGSLIVSGNPVTNAGTYSVRAYSGVAPSQISVDSSNAVLNIIMTSAFGDGILLSSNQYTFTNSVTIRLTNYLNNGIIFYTLDGSTPTPASAAYSAPFVLTSPATIRMLGYSSDFQQSQFSAPVSILFPTTFNLSTSTAGGGSITVNPPGGIYFSNTVINLTAVPSNGWTFLGWTGDAGGNSLSNTLIMDRSKSAQAIFGTTVGSSVGGNGSINFNPPGGIYPFGTVLQVSAVPQSGNFFSLWGGNASGNANPLSFPVTSANPSISALFGSLSGGQVALAAAPIGPGTVGVSPAANSYSTGASVTITATPANNHTFVGWSGGASGTNNPLNVQLNQSETIYANFSTNKTTLLVYPVTPPGNTDGTAIDLIGQIGAHYTLDVSSDLVTWSNLYNLTNYVGTIHYIDLGATNSTQRYYRARTIVP